MDIEAGYRKLDEISNRLVIQIQLLRKSIQQADPSGASLSRLRKKIDEIQGKLNSESPLFLHSPAKPLAGVKRKELLPVPEGKAPRIEGTFQAPEGGRKTRRRNRVKKPKH